MKNYIATTTTPSIMGYQRSIIYDLEKMKFEFIPNSLSLFLNILDKKSISDIYNLTADNDKSILDDYIKYCEQREYILEIPKNIDKKNFQKLSLNFEIPSIISNICISLNSKSLIEKNKIKELLEFTKCYNLQLIGDVDFDNNNLPLILSTVSELGIQSIELILKYSNDFNYESLVNIHKNISFIYVYESPLTKYIKPSFYGLQQVLFSEKKFQFTQMKSYDFFNVHISLFTESQKHNTYFNQKLYIDTNGEIKNAPLSERAFGNINDLNDTTEILDIINTKEFKKYWYVHKNIVDVCKQCEFRHMCVDNREPIQRNEKEWYHQSECNYNPYIAKWQDEDGYKTLTECGVTSNAEGFKINRKKLNAINKELWGDD